jgi:hypothetical protein
MCLVLHKTRADVKKIIIFIHSIKKKIDGYLYCRKHDYFLIKNLTGQDFFVQ